MALLLFWMVLFLPNAAHADTTRHYEIRLVGFKIGELKASQITINDSTTHFELRCDVSFWLFQQVKVNYTNLSRYIHSQLIYSEVNTVSNKGDFYTVSRWHSDHYQVHVNAYNYKKDTIIQNPIHFNVAKMYFEMPPDNVLVYADGYGILSPFQRFNANQFYVSVRGNRNKYLFDKGKLTRASMHSSIKNYEIIFVE